MRTRFGLLVALLVVLAGCNAPLDPGSDGTPADGTTTSPSGPAEDLPDPSSDVLGWESGYWYNESVSVTADDGLNASERNATIARAMARIERVRGLEFTEEVPVTLVSRAEYRNQSGGGGESAAFRQFDNTKFEALFMIGEDENSLEVQNQNRGSNVLGYYSPRNDSIVIVSESDTPQFDAEGTLSHELVHALQDQHFNLSARTAPTREQYNAQNGLIEGEANLIRQRYMQHCEDGSWSCLPSAGERGGDSSADQSALHYGVYFLNYFPYSDGPGFVEYVRAREGWEGVSALYEDLPTSTEQVIYPRLYGSDQPQSVSIDDTNSNGWERLRPEAPREGQQRADYAELGQSGLSAMFAYTFADEYNSSSVISPREFYNLENNEINRTDPLNYDLAYTSGWDGDRMHVYSRDGQQGYVWKLVWDSPGDAREFAAGYRQLLSHWGGEQVSENVWRIQESSPFGDAFRLRVEGDTVTVVNAPTTDDLDDVHAAGG